MGIKVVTLSSDNKEELFKMLKEVIHGNKPKEELIKVMDDIIKDNEPEEEDKEECCCCNCKCKEEGESSEDTEKMLYDYKQLECITCDRAITALLTIKKTKEKYGRWDILAKRGVRRACFPEGWYLRPARGKNTEDFVMLCKDDKEIPYTFDNEDIFAKDWELV